MTGRQFFLDISTNLFDYFGSIASYIVIAIPIFAGIYDHLDEPELAQGINSIYHELSYENENIVKYVRPACKSILILFIVISETAFVCMYLMYNFSKFADMAGNISKMAGVTHR